MHRLVLRESERIGRSVEQFVARAVRKWYKNTDVRELLQYSITSAYRNDFRPLLVREVYHVCGGKMFKNVLPACAITQLVNVSSVIVDDIVDRIDFCPQIRNKKVVCSRFGDAGAIATATSFLHLAQRIFFRYYKNLPSSESLWNLMNDSHEKLFLSFFLETQKYEKKRIETVRLQDYYSLIKQYASSPLLSFPLVLGSWVGGGSREVQKLFLHFGEVLGVLAQIRDDFLDYLPRELSGKEPYEDIRARKKRFPVLMAYQIGTIKERRWIKNFLGRREAVGRFEIQKMSRLICSEKVEDVTKRETEQIYVSAKKALEKVFRLSGSKSSILKYLLNFFAMSG